MSVCDDGSEGVAFQGAMRGRAGHESDGDGVSERSVTKFRQRSSNQTFAIPEFRDMTLALESLDGEDQVWFSTRACTLKRVPRMVRGPFRDAMRQAMDTIIRGHAHHQ